MMDKPTIEQLEKLIKLLKKEGVIHYKDDSAGITISFDPYNSIPTPQQKPARDEDDDELEADKDLFYSAR